MVKNLNNKKEKSMACIVRGGKESLLGRRDGEALRIIKMYPNGAEPEGCSLPHLNLEEDHNQVGRVRLNPIYIHLKDHNELPIAQKLRPVALHLMEP